MNKQIEELLVSNSDEAVKNEKERKRQEKEKMAIIFDKASKNTDKLNYMIIKTILNTYIKAKKRERKHNKNDYVEHGSHEVFYPNICYFDNSNDKTIRFAPWHCQEIKQTARRLADKDDIELSKLYNSKHNNTKIVFCIFEENKQKTVVPAVFNIADYKKAGFLFTFNGDANSTISTYRTLKQLKYFLKNVLEKGSSSYKMVNEDSINLIKQTINTYNNREKIISTFKETCQRNLDIISYRLCESFIKMYQENPNSVYQIKLPTLFDKDLRKLNDNELENYNNIRLCDTNNIGITYISYLGSEYKPVLTQQFVKTLNDLNFSSQLEINNDTSLIISTNSYNLERLMKEAKKRKKEEKIKTKTST